MYKVKNWQKYQHYKNRNPPWIKLHFELLASEDWVTLSDASRVLAVACMLLASRNDGFVPSDLNYLKRVAYLHTEPDFTELLDCGFLVLPEDASKMLANASVSVSSSVSVSEGGVGETSKLDDVFQDLPKELDTPEFRTAWKNWESYIRKKKGRAIQPYQRSPAWHKTLEEFKGHSIPDAVVTAMTKAMAEGWSSYYPPKVEPKKPHDHPHNPKTAEQVKAEQEAFLASNGGAVDPEHQKKTLAELRKKLQPA